MVESLLTTGGTVSETGLGGRWLGPVLLPLLSLYQGPQLTDGRLLLSFS